jgi:hypothetical protein
MALEACKVPINAKAKSATDTCRNWMDALEAYMAMNEWDRIARADRDRIVNRAIHLDSLLRDACRDHASGYADLFDEILLAVPTKDATG